MADADVDAARTGHSRAQPAEHPSGHEPRTVRRSGLLQVVQNAAANGEVATMTDGDQ